MTKPFDTFTIVVALTKLRNAHHLTQEEHDAVTTIIKECDTFLHYAKLGSLIERMPELSTLTRTKHKRQPWAYQFGSNIYGGFNVSKVLQDGLGDTVDKRHSRGKNDNTSNENGV